MLTNQPTFLCQHLSHSIHRTESCFYIDSIILVLKHESMQLILLTVTAVNLMMYHDQFQLQNSIFFLHEKKSFKWRMPFLKEKKMKTHQ